MELADELGVTPRTIYRDVATLVAQGAPIAGEAGLGYVLRPGFFLPPLMFDEDELDAIVLGLGLVGRRGDEELARAARHALAKIEVMLPPAKAEASRASPLLAGRLGRQEAPWLPVLRRAIRGERRLELRYVDAKGAASERVVWPFAIGFFQAADVLAAWCETRADFRHFRLDRIAAATLRDDAYPRRRRILLAEWRAQQDIDD